MNAATFKTRLDQPVPGTLNLRLWHWVGPVLFAVAAVGALILWFENEQAFMAWKRELDPLSYFVLLTVAGTVGVPTTPFYLLAGVLFGPWTALAGAASSVLGYQTLSYLIARGPLSQWTDQLRDMIERRTPSGWLHQPAARIALVRIMPGLPGALKNYAAAAMGAHLPLYLAVSWPLGYVGAAALVVLGDSFATGRPVETILALIMVLPIVLIAYRLKQRWRQTSLNTVGLPGATPALPLPAKSVSGSEGGASMARPAGHLTRTDWPLPASLWASCRTAMGAPASLCFDITTQPPFGRRTTMSTLDSTAPLAPPATESQRAGHSTRSRPWRRRLMWGGILTVIVSVAAASFWVSREPKLFDPVDAALARAPVGVEELPAGAVLSATVVEIIDTLLSKPGGFLSNDIAPPFALLDNMPSWEYGVLTELRDTVRALRNDFGRAQSQSIEDTDLMIADAQLHFSPDSWMLPSSEDEYRQGMAALERYFNRLTDGNPVNARFFARTDNLNFYLATVEKRLGNLSQRLSASAQLPDLEIHAQPDVLDEAIQPGGTMLGLGEVSWLDADNVFFEARGYLWALVHMLKALEQDFAPLLAGKQATVPMHEIILKLELAQQRVWSPVILTHSGFGVFTNHSLVLASYISRANAAIIDLRRLLAEG